jgi:hypothetical protein
VGQFGLVVALGRVRWVVGFELVVGAVQDFVAEVTVGFHHHPGPLDHYDHAGPEPRLEHLHAHGRQTEEHCLLEDIQGNPHPASQLHLDGVVDQWHHGELNEGEEPPAHKDLVNSLETLPEGFDIEQLPVFVVIVDDDEHSQGDETGCHHVVDRLVVVDLHQPRQQRFPESAIGYLERWIFSIPTLADSLISLI